MKHAVAFVKPAGIFVYQIEEVAAGLHAELFADGLLADGEDGGSARGIDKRNFVGNLNLRGHGGDAEGDAKFHRHFGVHFDDFAPCRKTFSGQVQAVNAKRQILKHVMSIVGNFKRALEAVAFAEEFAAGSDGCALGIMDVQMQLAAEALRTYRRAQCQAEEAEQQGQPIEPVARSGQRHCKNES